MKFRVVLSALFLSACVAKSKSSTMQALEYDKVRSFLVGTSTESEVVTTLGLPTSRTEENGYYTFIYDDSKTGHQRLSISFLTESCKVSSLLWVPYEGEKEYSLTYAKADFKNARFKEVIDSNKNPHAISPDAISYIDEKIGVTIRYDKNHRSVEAIAMYDVKSRLPAETNKKTQVPYTFGDETIISK